MLNKDVIIRAIKLYQNLIDNSLKTKTKDQIYSCEKMNIGVYLFLFCLMPLLEKLDEYDLQNDKFKKIPLNQLEEILNISLN